MTPTNQQAIALLESLGDSGFWGTLTFKLQHGQVTHITKEESIQPEPKHRRPHDQHSN